MMKKTRIFIASFILILLSVTLTSSTTEVGDKVPPPPRFTIHVTVDNVPTSAQDATVTVYASGISFIPSSQNWNPFTSTYDFYSGSSTYSGTIYVTVTYYKWANQMGCMTGTASISGDFTYNTSYPVTVDTYIECDEQ